MVVIISDFFPQPSNHEMLYSLALSYPSSHIAPHSPSTLCVLATQPHTVSFETTNFFRFAIFARASLPDGQILSPNPLLSLSLEQELASFFFAKGQRVTVLGCEVHVVSLVIT